MMKRVFMVTMLWMIFSLISMAQVNDGWNISTETSDNYTGIVLANGTIGILPTSTPFGVKHVVLNHVFDKDPYHQVSRVLHGMNFGNLEITVDGERITSDNIHQWSQTFDMKEAKLVCSFEYKDKAKISYELYALRNLPQTGYFNVNIKALKDIEVKVCGKIVTPKSDYQEPVQRYQVLADADKSMPILQSLAKSRYGLQTVSTSATFVWPHITSAYAKARPELKHTTRSKWEHTLSFRKALQQKDSLDFVWSASVCSSQNFFDPKSESERIAIYTLLTPRKTLIDQHVQRWKNLWRGDIIIEGDIASQQDVRLALYHLYAFGRAGNDLSIAPMGLSVQSPYNGHIFWDTELWMFPPLLLFNQGIANSLVNYRYDRLEAAKRRATTYGYKGAMYPWESDFSGEEATPPYALTGPFEHHITADIGIAFWNYYCVTKDKEWLKSKGYPVLKEVADFWTSRVTKNVDGTYSILNVIGADEYATNIDDNAFTNGAVQTVLHYATQAAKEVGIKPISKWKEIANGLQIHRFEDGTVKEYKTYDGAIIKQADVNLLSYPLHVVTDSKTIAKNLAYYEPKLAPEGPAMGRAIFAVNYARMGDASHAYSLFKASYEPNKHPPFGALSETATANRSYFATGAGGMLQVVLFGFGGLQFTENGIIQKKPMLPKQWKSLTIKGVGPKQKTFIIR
ncbi:hypothetical protein K4L44_04010 [Halosquirtibacter laminarini]|uniref:Uncharacterized protein n=1 Tax=Halosquirtibacter laminarini TaxID=3374600 RepID=A0AC61NNP2_9BACT|nr:hypothetical protein K4L44_04010 [Prolixibacteraceae bacterium]